MTKEIYITSNTPLQIFTSFRKHNIDSIKLAAIRAGCTTKIVDTPSMFMDINPVPYAAINFTGWASDRHVVYLKELESLKVKMLNPVYNARIADDKMLSYYELLQHVPVTTTMYLDVKWPPTWWSLVNKINQTIGFPCVVKVNNSGRGLGVHKVHNSADLVDLLGLLYTCIPRVDNGQTASNLLVQKYISESQGRNVRVFVLGNRCLGAMIRTNAEHWKTGQPADDTFGINEKRERFEIDQELESISLKVCQILNLNYAAIDFLFGKDGYIVNEINTCPDIKAFEECNNLSVYDRVIDHLINVMP